MKSKRSTSSLISHLESQHGVTRETPVETDPHTQEGFPSGGNDDGDPGEQEPPPLGTERLTPGKRKRQAQVDTYFNMKRHTLRGDTHRLICLSNVSFNQLVADDTHRRLLITSHPSDDPPPRSAATLRKHLAEDSSILRTRHRSGSEPRF